MSETKTSDKRTILDYLNEDCWRAVLGYVPLEDILRTEPTSRYWQEIVLKYLRGVHIDVVIPGERKMFQLLQILIRTVKRNKVRGVRIGGNPRSSFDLWTNKLGASVKSASCDTEEGFKLLRNCPNLENLTLMELPENVLLQNQNENFKWLKRLSFKDCPFLSDRCVDQFMVNNTLEELKIDSSLRVSGQFLVLRRPTKLKSLVLTSCGGLDADNLFKASDHLSELRKLELNDVEIPDKIYLIFDKMLKLEHVIMTGTDAMSDSSKLFKAICQLKNLKYLCVDSYASDTDIEAVTRSCPQLQTLRLKACIGVTGRGLAAACDHAGARLVMLAVRNSRYLTNDDVVACIRACPKLKFLSVRDCRALTRGLFARAAAARRELRARRPLRLRCSIPLSTKWRNRLKECKELIVLE